MKKCIIALIFIVVSLFFLIIRSIDNYSSNKNYQIDINTLNNRQIISWGLNKMIDSKLTSEFDGYGVKIAILDSGIKSNHPDFGDNIKMGFNAIDTNKFPEDDFGHGTLVAGIIGAQNNNFGIQGIAPHAEIYPVKVLDEYGEGNISDIARAIDWCIDNNIQIINMSFAILKDNALLYNSVKKASDAGIILVAAVDNSYGGEVGYPACYNEVISVTAVNEDYKISNTAPKGKIDFCAPGVNIISTTNSSEYEVCSGTSFAAPYISGMISLILQKPQEFGLNVKGAYSHSDIYNILKGMTNHLGKKGKNSTFGEGFPILKINIKN